MGGGSSKVTVRVGDLQQVYKRNKHVERHRSIFDVGHSTLHYENGIDEDGQESEFAPGYFFQPDAQSMLALKHLQQQRQQQPQLAHRHGKLDTSIPAAMAVGFRNPAAAGANATKRLHFVVARGRLRQQQALQQAAKKRLSIAASAGGADDSEAASEQENKHAGSTGAAAAAAAAIAATDDDTKHGDRVSSHDSAPASRTSATGSPGKRRRASRKRNRKSIALRRRSGGGVLPIDDATVAAGAGGVAGNTASGSGDADGVGLQRCCVCTKQPSDPWSADCGHVCCHNCWISFLAEHADSHVCPQCNATVDAENLKRVTLCPVCSRQPNDPVKSQCGHSCCRQCWQNYLRENDECPTCGVAVDASILAGDASPVVGPTPSSQRRRSMMKLASGRSSTSSTSLTNRAADGRTSNSSSATNLAAGRRASSTNATTSTNHP